METEPIDLAEFLREFQAQQRPEIDLETLHSGDVLVIATANTIYKVVMENARSGALSTNRANRPVGAIQLIGGTFGFSSVIKPERIFCGGSLEYLHQPSNKIHVTSEIQGLWLVSRPCGNRPSTPQ